MPRLYNIGWQGKCPRLSSHAMPHHSPSLRHISMGGLSSRQGAQQRRQEVLPCNLGQASGQRSDATPAMQPQALEGSAQAVAAEAVLLEAAAFRRQKPAAVLSALQTLEDLHKAQASAPDMLSRLARPWRLVFSGPNKLAFLSYIPVNEDFVVKAEDGSLALESDLGPIHAKFKGRFEWRADSNEMHFAFNQAQADLWGRQVWTKEVDFKPKTYSFFWASDAIACARSSAGTLTLLKALQP